MAMNFGSGEISAEIASDQALRSFLFCPSYMEYTQDIFNIAMENHNFLIAKPSIYHLQMGHFPWLC